MKFKLTKLNQKSVNLSDFKVYVTKMGGEPSIKTTNKKPEGEFVTLKATDEPSEPTYEDVKDA